MPQDRTPRSKDLAARVIYAALQILQQRGGQASRREILAEVESRITLDEWALGTYEKTGNVRWKAILHFYSIDCIKAGYLIKNNGIWYITPEGEIALSLGAIGLLAAANAAYRKWKETSLPVVIEDDEPTPESQQEQEATIQDIEQRAVEGLKKQIGLKNPYEFQDLAVALLRGMGYHTPFVAPLGKDGGIDIVAYRDPFGTSSPRIKAQVKHRPNTPATVQELRQLMGLLQKDGDVGIFISSGGFTSDAKSTARSSHVHVELIDLDRFIALWQEFHDKLGDIDKFRLPLKPIFFYAPAI
jgi:restriction system protein